MIFTGIVNDNEKSPLFAAAVYESDLGGNLTGKGTTTNEGGEFSLRGTPDGFISVQYLGFKPTTFKKGENFVIIDLQPATFNLPPVTIKPKPGAVNYLKWVLIGLGIYSVLRRR